MQFLCYIHSIGSHTFHDKAFIFDGTQENDWTGIYWTHKWKVSNKLSLNIKHITFSMI